MKIDETDAKILRTLLSESRTGFTRIAKDLRISVAAVRKRYKRLQKTGIINGEIMQVNPYILGYKCIVQMGIASISKGEGEVIESLKSKPYTHIVFRNVFERTNIAAIISLHDIQELSDVIQKIEANPLVKYTSALIWNKTVVDHPENLVLAGSIDKSKQVHKPKPSTNNFEKVRIDQTDRQIARILSRKSRTPLLTIAKELNISTKKVTERYNKLRGPVLVSSTITIDLKKLGYNAMAHIMIKAHNKSKTEEISADLLQIPNLIVLIEFVGGGYDLFPIIVLRNYEELFVAKERLSMIQGIEQIGMILSEPYPAWPLNLFTLLL